jgi:site-specific DNA-adenine methylase
LYKGLKNGLKTNIRMEFNPEAYFENRSRFNALIAGGKGRTWEAAQLFFYLIQSCFNGLSRFNKSGFYNVPIGSYKSVNYERDNTAYERVFQGWELRVEILNK